MFIFAGNKDVVSSVSITGIPSIALNSESMTIPVEIELFLSTVAKKIHVFYDNDATGGKAKMNLCMATDYKSHGPLLTKFTDNTGAQINDFSRLIDVKKGHPAQLRKFFGLLKETMKPKKNLFYWNLISIYIIKFINL